MLTPEIGAYDWIVINTSAGKDSQAMMDYVISIADENGVSRSKIVAVHADLGRMEWEGTRELAGTQSRHYGIRFEVVSRPQGDLLSHVRSRGMWPSSTSRYCTSDHKRGQVSKVLTMLARESGKPVRILNCLGMRSQESPARAKLIPFQADGRNTNGRRKVDTWLPIHSWTVEQVWARIRESGVPHHRAYDLGMPRLSCCFCIFSPRKALLIAGKHNPTLLDEYVSTERRIGHDFRKGFKIESIRDAIASGEESDGSVEDWIM